MIESVIIKYLSGALPDPVYGERPKDRPARYYLVEKVGGGRGNHLRSSMIAVRSVAVVQPGISRAAAAQMHEDMLAAMINDTGGVLVCPEITGIELNSDTNLTDPEAFEYAYQALFDVYHY